MSQFIQDNFFIVTSDNCKETKSKIYGYAIDKDQILINSQINCDLQNDCYGCYVNVQKLQNYLKISQDYFGSYGLYLYKQDNYWALSNSFLYLLNYLKSKVLLSINNEFIKSFLAAPSASLCYRNTMVKEVEMLPKNAIVTINSDTKEIKIEYCSQKERYISINSKEGIELIDNWHKKWGCVINSLINSNQCINFRLSGGKDSRVSLATLFHSNINLEKINFYSAKDNLYTHSEDFDISSKISKILNFSLNTFEKEERYKMDPSENLNSSLLVKCGFHKELMFSHFWRNKTSFAITGSGGDLRDLWESSVPDFINDWKNRTICNSVNLAGSLEDSLLETKAQIDNDIGDISEYSANDYFYKNGRQRNHNGKANVESFLSNVIILSPLMDPLLYKLTQKIGKNNDNDLLYSVIYDRFLKPINDIPFDSSRIVIDETWKVAKQINKEFPFVQDNSITKEDFKIYCSREKPTISNKTESSLDVLNNIFNSNAVKEYIYNFFGEEVYYRALAYYKNSYHSYIYASGLVQSYLIYNIVKTSESNIEYDNISLNLSSVSKQIKTPNYYFNSGIIKEIYDYLQSLRIEISVIGSSKVVLNNVSDKDAFTEIPSWLVKKNGNGYLIQSHTCSNSLDILFHSFDSGELNICVKGPFMKSSDNSLVLNIVEDVTKCLLKNIENNEILYNLENVKCVNSFEYIHIKCNLIKNHKYLLRLNWFPHIYECNELSELINELKLKSINAFKFWKNNICN